MRKVDTSSHCGSRVSEERGSGEWGGGEGQWGGAVGRGREEGGG